MVLIPLESDNCYVGGVPKSNFIRIVVEKIARQMLAPHIANRPELEWELHLAETDFDLWRVQGLQPPKAGSAGDQQWNRENKTRPCESAKKIEFIPAGMIGTSSDPITVT